MDIGPHRSGAARAAQSRQHPEEEHTHGSRRARSGGVAPAGRGGPPLPDPRLTARQRKVLRVIREWVDEHGYPPSVREIGDAVGLQSTSSVHHQLRTLERKGYLRRDPNRTRAVDVRLPEEQPHRADSTTSTRRAASPRATSTRSPRSSPCWATSRQAARSWPSRPWRACSRCRARSSARARCSC